MALLIAEGFDRSNVITDYNDVLRDHGNRDLIAGRFGGYAIGESGSSVGSSISFGFQEPLYTTHLIIGFSFKYSANPGAVQLIYIQDERNSNSYKVASLWIKSDGSLVVSRSGNGSAGPPAPIATSATGLLVANTWYHVEWKIKMAESPDGSTELRLNGATVASATGVDSQHDSIQEYCFVGFFYGHQTSNATGVFFDDFYVIDADDPAEPADFLGETRIETLFPVADVGTPTMTSTAGTLYETVDESVLDTSDYITGSPGSSAQFEIGNLSGIPTQVHAVRTTIVNQKTDANNYHLRTSVQSATVESAKTFIANAGSLENDSATYAKDPNGNISWTGETVNALKLNIEVA